jgi:hypothetical protein
MFIIQAEASEFFTQLRYPDLLCASYCLDTGNFVHNDSWGLIMKLKHHEELPFSLSLTVYFSFKRWRKFQDANMLYICEDLFTLNASLHWKGTDNLL